MSELASLSEVINRLTGGNSGTPDSLWFHKAPRRAGAAPATPIAGRWTSLWMYDGVPGAPSGTPGAVAAPTNTTAGGLQQADPGGGREKWLLGMGVGGNSAGTLLLYDRLLHISGLSGTTTTAQTVGGSLTRYTDGLGNLIAYEVYTQIGASTTTCVCSYTDQDGNSGQTTSSLTIGNTNNREAEAFRIFTLATGDRGVQAVANVDLVASTGTAGDFGITVFHPLAVAQVISAGVGPWMALLDPHGPIEIQTDACLAMAWMPNAATIPILTGNLSMVER